MEDRGADALGLEQVVDRLHEGVVVGVADGPDRGGDALEVEVLGVPDRGVLPGFNRSLQHRVVGVSVAALRRLRWVSSSRDFCGVGC